VRDGFDAGDAAGFAHGLEQRRAGVERGDELIADAAELATIGGQPESVPRELVRRR